MTYRPDNVDDIYEAVKIFRKIFDDKDPRPRSLKVQDFLAPVLRASLEYLEPTIIRHLFDEVMKWAEKEPKLHDHKKTAFEAMQEEMERMQQRMYGEIFSSFYGPGAKTTFGDGTFRDFEDSVVGGIYTIRMNASGSEFQRSRQRRNPPPPPPPPPPAPPPLPDWRTVLDIPGWPMRPTEAEVRAAYRRAAAKAHPDAGGSTQAMQALNDARDAALREIGAKT